MKSLRQSELLLQTSQGAAWIQQFDAIDRDVALTLLDKLYLVSSSDFSAGIHRLLEIAIEELPKDSQAMYAAREMRFDENYFDSNGKVKPLAEGNDQGSEALAAHFIRQICKASSKTTLNHPEIELSRKSKTRRFLIVDDFIGSGRRIVMFLNSIWRNRTIKSWHSAGLIKFVIVCYSGTKNGIEYVSTHPLSPTIKLVTTCPTLLGLPLQKKTAEAIVECCKKYGSKTCKKHMRLGYQDSMSTLVFQHGCPNNTPSMLWAPSTPSKPWNSLFPNRSVLSTDTDIFPDKSRIPDYIEILEHLGQKRLARSGSLVRRGEFGKQILMILALVSKGVRKVEFISHSTYFSHEICQRILDSCVVWGFLTPTFRITSSGSAELNAARKKHGSSFGLLIEPDPYYHPTQLRGLHKISDKER